MTATTDAAILSLIDVLAEIHDETLKVGIRESSAVLEALFTLSQIGNAND